MGAIQLKEALKVMDTGQEFNISYVGADKNRRDFGDWIDIPKCTKMASNAEQYKKGIILLKVEGQKNPRACHPRLITKFNGMQVIY